MKLEEFPEFRRGDIAEIGFNVHSAPSTDRHDVEGTSFNLFYIDSIAYLKFMPSFSEIPGETLVYGEQVKEGLPPHLLVYDKRYVDRKTGEVTYSRIYARTYSRIYARCLKLEDIVSFRLLKEGLPENLNGNDKKL